MIIYIYIYNYLHMNLIKLKFPNGYYEDELKINKI
jgi:hypothetical protein